MTVGRNLPDPVPPAVGQGHKKSLRWLFASRRKLFLYVS